MSEPTSPTNPQPPETDEALIINPISIARARHASTRKRPILNPTPPSSGPSPNPTNRVKASPPINLAPIGGLNNYLLFPLLALVFLTGGVLGGMMGGGLILWASSPSGLAFLVGTATPAPLPTPTPMPAATSTPTPTPEPVATVSTEDVIAAIIPSVVTVINQQSRTFALSRNDGRVVGSGVIIDSRGYIVTNHHVVENPGDISVILADGREELAELVASDPSQDLAIVKVNVANLPAITWGDSLTIRPGQAVYAIGSPLGDFPNSVSFGIISGLRRALEINGHVIDGLIQTDAAINRGSSGGPLVNVKGEVIGINTFIIRESEDRGVAEGIAFAIPAGTAQKLLIPWIAAHSGQSEPIPASGEPGN